MPFVSTNISTHAPHMVKASLFKQETSWKKVSILINFGVPWLKLEPILFNFELICFKFESDSKSKMFTCLHSQGLKTQWGPQNYNIKSQPNAHATTRHVHAVNTHAGRAKGSTCCSQFAPMALIWWARPFVIRCALVFMGVVFKMSGVGFQFSLKSGENWANIEPKPSWKLTTLCPVSIFN